MAEPAPVPRPALAKLIEPGRHGRADGPAGLRVSERTGLALASVIARKNEAATLAALVRSAYGVELPTTPRRADRAMPDGSVVAFIWAGPAQWLALAEGRPGFVPELARALARHAMVAEQSDGRCVLRLAGPKARAVLAKGAPLDLDVRVFKPGDTALTQISHMGVQLWQLDDAPTYEIAVFRSLAGSFWSWLTASAAEFGYEAAVESD